MKKNLFTTIGRIAMHLMKGMLVLCMFTGVLLAEHTEAQSIEDVDVSLSLTHATLAETFTSIEAQTDFKFLYQKGLLSAHSSTITLKVEKKSVKEVLVQIMEQTGLSFKQVNNTIAVSDKRNKKKVLAVSVKETFASPVNGKVTDNAGEPIPGVNVLVKGTTQGTVTDIDGNYRLNVPDDATGRHPVTLLFSFVGYQTQEVLIGNQSVINISLEEDITSLGDIVVVGYGTQKKVNLTGAVDQVSSEVLEDRPITNLAQGLQGTVPNLNITFANGQPGSGAEFNIRGITSINKGEPLILIDGIPGDPNLINPRDIESVSVLKDAASSAIYGARGAYGVILITTKRAERDQLQVNYSANFSSSRPTIIPKAVTDTYTSMQMYNDAYKGYSGNDFYTQEQMDYAMQRSADPTLPAVLVRDNGGEQSYEYYGNTDWFDEMYEDSNPMQQHNLSIAGGSDKVNYFLSGGYLRQKGIFEYNPDVYERFNLRTKINVQLTDWLEINNNLMYNRADYDFPTNWGGTVDIWRYVAILGFAHAVPQNPDGTWTFEGFPTAFLKEGGRGLKKESLLQNTIGFNMSFLKDKSWRITGNYTYQNDKYSQNEHYKTIEYSNVPGVISERGVSQAMNESTDNYYHVFNLFTEYEKDFNRHYFKGMIGFNQELRTFNKFNASRYGLISDLSSLNLAVGDMGVGGEASEWALRGVFYRLNYSFDDRYLLEFNGRYDGTSRFPMEDRFGFFPSVSAAWRMSEESFFGGLRDLFPNLKLRASYGTLGNQQVATYAYVPSMGSYVPALVLEGERPVVVGSPNLVSPNLTWEKATTLDFGIDINLLQRLDLSFDWYNRETSDMLIKSKTLPAVLGTEEPLENAADLETKGWELSVKWNDNVQLLGKDFRYDLGVVLSDYKAEITRFDNPNRYLGDYYVGQQFGEIWGLQTEGFFQSEEELLNHADQTEIERFPDNLAVGDLKFYDRNGDGAINYGENTVDEPGDRFVIGNTTPRYNYGFRGGFSWNNFSFSIFFQGIGKRDYYPGGEEAYFWSVYNRYYNTPLQHLVGNYWTPDNPDAYFPRLKAYIALQDDKSLSAPQTRYLQDASYLRLKNLTVGYTIPQEVTRRIGVERFRVYFSGENLWERTNLVMPVDPESILTTHSWGDGQTYPFSRTYSLGLDITF